MAASRPSLSHDILVQAVLVNWHRLVESLDCWAVFDKLMDRSVLAHGTADHALLTEKHASKFTFSWILLERMIARKRAPVPFSQRTALQEFFVVICEVHGRDGDLAANLLASAADTAALQQDFDALCMGSVPFQSLSDRELAELPVLSHLNRAPMPESVRRLRARLQELYAAGNFGAFGACSSDYNLLAHDSVGDENRYVPISLLPLAGHTPHDGQSQPTRLQDPPTPAAAASRAKTVELQHIFSSGEGRPQRTKCLLIGPPGAGKTMTSLEILRQWARCSMFAEHSLALYVGARRITAAMRTVWDVMDLAGPKYGLDAAAMGEVRDYASQHSRQILIVMDGLDELKPSLISERSPVFGVLSGTAELGACRVVATSRPCRQARELQGATTLHYQLCELRLAQQLAMMRSRLREDDVARFREKLDAAPQLWALMANPLHASLIITQFARLKRLPTGLCDVYGDVVISALKRFVTRTINRLHSTTTTTTIGGTGDWSADEASGQPHLGTAVERVVKQQPQPQGGNDGVTFLVDALDYLERMALDGICEQQYLFDVASTQAQALETGLLVAWGMEESKTHQLGTACQFIHLSIQEFMAACMIARQSDCRRLIEECVGEKIALDETRYNFWLCLAGMLDKEHLCFLLERACAVARNGSFEQRKVATRLLLHSLAQVEHESGSHSCWRVRAAAAATERLEVTFADVLDGGTLDLSHHRPDDQYFEVVCKLLDKDWPLKVLNLESCLLDEKRCKRLALCPGIRALDTLHIGVNQRISDTGLPPLLKALGNPISSSLVRMSIRSCGLAETDIPAICDFLASTATLDELYLHKTVPVLSAASCRLLAAAIRWNTSLTHVICSCMAVDDDGACALAEAAAQQGKIDRLLFRENCIGDRGARACLRAAAALGCHRVDLSFNRITEAVLPELERTLEQLQRVEHSGRLDTVELWLSGNAFSRRSLDALVGAAAMGPDVTLHFGFVTIGQGAVRELSEHTIDKKRFLPHGTYSQLNLTFLGMGDEYAQRLEDYLARLKGYASLSYGHNLLTSVAMASLSRALRKNVHIQALDLSSNRVGVEGLEAIVSAICRRGGANSTLRYLSLQGNPLAPAGMDERLWQRLKRALYQLVCECPHLELLGLHATGIGDRGLAVLGEFFPERSSLMWLSVANNRLTDDGVAPLCERLALNRSLRILDLSYNLLGSDAVTALNDMQSKRIDEKAPPLDPVCLEGNRITGDEHLGPGLLNGRLYFQYSTTILSLLDSLKAARAREENASQ